MLDYKSYLKNYNGEPLRLMEVCGSHTAAISHCGIVSLLSPKIKLISGPGCPVCVTVSSYIDRLVALSMEPNQVVVSFGDLLRVKGSGKNLNDAKAEGGQVQMVYSPMDTLKLAVAEPAKTFIFAAIGFETTTPVYALLLEEAQNKGIHNIKLLTSLKTMPQVIDWVCGNESGINGFIAPGHVSVITGSDIYQSIANRYHIPFAVAGFEAEQILLAIYALVRRHGKGEVMNLYPSVVTSVGNQSAQQVVSRYFTPCDASWRGMGAIQGSGMQLRPEYERFDAGSENLTEDYSANPNCRCARVLTGAISPRQCPLFGKVCNPQSPQGACMVSTEGSCYQYYVNRRE
jgi:hydrogenase expression/formation protein HypD